MTLGTHIVVAGAAGAVFIGNPIAGLFAAIVSHFVVDAIPHWDWPICSIEKTGERCTDGVVGNNKRAILRDFFIAGLDSFWGVVVLGLTASYFNISIVSPWFIAVVIGGILPDGLQFLYFLYRKEPLTTIQRFHGFMHTNIKIPSERFIYGPLLQLPVVLIALLVFFAVA